MQNIKYKALFYILFIQTKKQNKHNKNDVKIHIKSLTYMLGGETANCVNFMQPLLISYSSYYFSPLKGDIGNVSELVFILYRPVRQFRPVFR